MQKRLFGRWLSRGFRLALVVGVVAAAWQSWTNFSLYEADQQSWAETRLLYECAARINDDVLAAQVTKFGTVNMKGQCSFDGEDHWVALSEIADVRSGVLQFASSLKPFRMESTVSAGFFAFFTTMLSTLSLLAVVRLVQWVWGKAES